MSDLSRRAGSPYWLIVRDSSRVSKNLEVFLLDSGGGKLLPLCNSEESAELLRRHLIDAGAAPDGEWRIRATGAGELISLLSGSAFSAGSCAGVERVLLEPPPEILDRDVREREIPAGESRGCFMERLMGRGRPWFEMRDRKEDR